MSAPTPEMRRRRQELIVGSILLAFAVAWTVTVYFTVPPGRSTGVGPRAFPLALGIGLTFLSGILVLSSLIGLAPQGESSTDGDGEPPPAYIEPWAQTRIIATVFALIASYGYLMQNAGFVLATIIIVTVTLWVTIGFRRPLLVAGMSLGITAGCWLIFGRLLGAYIPRGTWLSFL